MAFVTVDAGTNADEGALRGLAAAFCSAGLPVVHVVDTRAAADATSADAELDIELLDDGGVQTLGPGEMAIALANGGGGAFDATPLDALLRAFGVDTVVVGGPVPSPRVSASVYAGELRGYRVLLATDELAVTLGAHITAA
ncbi:MAG: isochorismatase family protein [Acidimicrobiia bacterium]|nr:isochorismatase family protein [Acidimicrobiia bacterium]